MDKVIIAIMSSIIIVIMSVQFVLFGIPFIKQLQFERICHGFAMDMDATGGMDFDAVITMDEILSSNGFHITEADIPFNYPYGEEMHFYIKAETDGYRINKYLLLEILSIEMTYEFVLKSRNSGGEIIG